MKEVKTEEVIAYIRSNAGFLGTEKYEDEQNINANENPLGGIVGIGPCSGRGLLSFVSDKGKASFYVRFDKADIYMNYDGVVKTAQVDAACVDYSKAIVDKVRSMHGALAEQ